MSDPVIVVASEPDEADRKTIVDALIAFNDATAGPSGFQRLAILIRDPITGKTQGGLWGKTVFDWLFVELLVVPEHYRGRDVGTQVLRRAEEIARERGCIGVWLDTYEFQAPGFYQKLGYEIFGTIEDLPRGSRRVFLQKRL
jgi:GNAT superfamily N-acetyltransferase